MSEAYAIVCLRALQICCASPSGLSPPLPKKQTKQWIPKCRPLGIPLPLGDKEGNFGLIHFSTLHPSPQPTKKLEDEEEEEEEEEKKRLARGSRGVVLGSESD